MWLVMSDYLVGNNHIFQAVRRLFVKAERYLFRQGTLLDAMISKMDTERRGDFVLRSAFYTLQDGCLNVPGVLNKKWTPSKFEEHVVSPKFDL